MMEKNAKIYVAGHRGMVGSAIVRELERQGYTNNITRTHKELDLCRQDAVEEFFAAEKPEYVFLAAAKVGGIVANQNALADFMYDNMTLEMNVIHSAWKNGCKKLEFLGSSCIYPRMAPQPMKENCLLTSELEKTNEAYALAKISGLKYCEFLNRQYGTDYISVMPTNLYGPNDNYHPTHSHVVPALIRRFHEAKVNGVTSVTCWGDGSLCLETLDSMVKGGERVLDIGTGSGILAIAALKLGAAEAEGVDIDPMCVRTAGENAERNGVAEHFTVLVGDLSDKASGKYNIITANIVAAAILSLAPHVPVLMASGARFIASGIIDTRKDEVLAGLRAAGLEPVEIKEKRGWVCVICKNAAEV